MESTYRHALRESLNVEVDRVLIVRLPALFGDVEVREVDAPLEDFLAVLRIWGFLRRAAPAFPAGQRTNVAFGGRATKIDKGEM